ncbi:MAG TPA: hypothetical protein VHM88_11155 [Candidatus Acidoferrales bacterium]|nr:hypothetical protein [Candidatus Acidoferrales bacterium]
MTKYEVLAAFAQEHRFLTPDELLLRLRWSLDRRSVYSYYFGSPARASSNGEERGAGG